MPFIEGYLSAQSVAPGESVELFASSDAGSCRVRIVREGSPEREMHVEPTIAVGNYPVPDRSWETGPKWPACWRFTVPRDWPSGVYRVQLEADAAYVADPSSFTGITLASLRHDELLVVRAARPASTSKILLQLCTNTYLAYNRWGGHSVYAYHSLDKKPARIVSTLRPGNGYHSDNLFPYWERPFIQWCERDGIALEYATNYDLHRWPAGFDDYRLILSVGHDEYWSAPMRDHLESFIAQGGNAAFFSGNSVCWQVRFENDGATMVSYKEGFADDPYFAAGKHANVTTLWSHPLVGRPENLLTGVGFRMGGYHRSHGVMMDGSGAYTVRRPDHWVFAGTGLKAGDTFGGKSDIVGYECDGCFFTERDGLPVPTGEDGTPTDFTILAQAPANWTGDELVILPEGFLSPQGQATLGLYTRGGTVFTAGTTDWAHGLRDNDPAVARITRNVLTRLGS